MKRRANALFDPRPRGYFEFAEPELEPAAQPAATPIGGEAAASGGVQDVTAGYVSLMGRPNQDPVQASRGGLQIYEELMRDHAVATAFQQRQLALISKPLEVVAGGKRAIDKLAADHLAEQLQAIAWDSKTAAMLFGRIYGYAAAEFMWELRAGKVAIADVHVRKARRFAFGGAGELLLRTRARPYGEPLPERKFWVYTSHGDVTDDPYGFGLGQILYWLVWFKRNDLSLWLKALDKHATPTALGKFAPGAPQDERDKLLAALTAIRNSSAITIPEGFTVELLEAAKSGGADYQALYKMLDDAIAQVIAGQTMTSRDGSSKSQAEVHQSVLEWIVKADDDLLSDSFNAGPSRWLTEWNFPGAKVPRIRRRTEPPADLKEQAERDNILINAGFEPDEAYIKETYGPAWRRAKPVGPNGLLISLPEDTPDGGSAQG